MASLIINCEMCVCQEEKRRRGGALASMSRPTTHPTNQPASKSDGSKVNLSEEEATWEYNLLSPQYLCVPSPISSHLHHHLFSSNLRFFASRMRDHLWRNCSIGDMTADNNHPLINMHIGMRSRETCVQHDGCQSRRRETSPEAP